MSMQSHQNELTVEGDQIFPACASKADDDTIDWDESLLTDTFDNSLKLIERSRHIAANKNSDPIPKEPRVQTIPKPHANSKKPQTTQQNQKGTTPVVLTHQSRKFKYIESSKDQSEINVSNTENNDGNETKKLPTVTDNKQDIPVVPPVFDTSSFASIETEDEAFASMLTSWFVAGYQTGYYKAMVKFKGK